MLSGLFINGVCSAGRWTVTYVYLVEFMTEANIKYYVGMVNASAALALICGAFTFQVLTKDTAVLEYVSVALTVLSGLAGLAFLPESPKWLVGKGQMEQARQAYAYIAATNREDQHEIAEWTFKQ